MKPLPFCSFSLSYLFTFCLYIGLHMLSLVYIHSRLQ